MKRFNLVAVLVSGLVAFCGGSSTTSASGLDFNIQLEDGSNFNASVGDYPEGEQLSLGTTLNVENQRVEYASISLGTIPGNPELFQGTLDISGYDTGTMSLEPFRSLSFSIGGIHMFIGSNVEEYSSQNRIEEMFYNNWGNVSLPIGSNFTYVSFDQYFYPQGEGLTYVVNHYTFAGTRVALPGQVLQGFSVTQNLMVPEPTTLSAIGFTALFLRRRR